MEGGSGKFKSGFVAVIGRPNVGKSTLINTLLGQKIAAVSPRPQTTRRRQLGILTDEKAQIIFADTPGIHKPMHILGENMNQIALDTLRNADLILWLLDGTDSPTKEDLLIVEKLKKSKHLPEIILAVNKIDKIKPEKRTALRGKLQPLYPTAVYMEISALRSDALDELKEKIINLLPEAPPLYEADAITDLFEREIAADLIREAALRELREEIPHGIGVDIREFKERNEGLTYISTMLWVEKESHKAIVIGKGGKMLKQIGSLARTEIENMTGCKVYLDLRVKVMNDWRNNAQLLKVLGILQIRRSEMAKPEILANNILFYIMVVVCVVDWIAAELKKEKLRWFTKTASILLIIGWFSFVGHWQGALLWFGLGLVFSMVGDILLLFPDKLFLFGMIAFLLAHVMYIIGFNIHQTLPINANSLYILVGVVFLAVLILGNLLKGMSSKPESRKMRLPVLVYGIAISLMLISTLLNLIRPDWRVSDTSGQPAAILTVIGALFFYASDSMLAVRTFIKRFQHDDFLVMATYHIGQITIAAGTLFHFLK